MSSTARSSRSASSCTTSPSATACRARGTSCAACAATAAPGAARCASAPRASACTATARSPSTSCIPGENVWVHHVARRPRGRRDLRPVRQRRAHRARVPAGRRGRARHRLRARSASCRSPVARHVGARFIVATRRLEPARLELALQHGRRRRGRRRRRERIADAQRELGMREGFDVGFEMSGAPTALPEMIENMNHGGRIALLGLPRRAVSTIDWGKVVTHMLTIKGIYGREMFETWNSMSAMLQTSETLRDRARLDHQRPLPGARLASRLRRGRLGRRRARSSSTGRSSRHVRNGSTTSFAPNSTRSRPRASRSASAASTARSPRRSRSPGARC